jgi:hypothetical protein
MTINHDFRAKLQAKPGAKKEVYGGGSKNYNENLLAPIAYTNGLVFPYTPAIQVGHAQVDYSQYNLPQTNFDYMAFIRRASPTMSVTAPFTANNMEEARYLLATIHFLRTVTMTYFGRQNQERRGTPPPILLFSAYGPYMFEKIPVVIRTVSFGLEQDVDYVPAGFEPAAVPTKDLSPDERRLQELQVIDTSIDNDYGVAELEERKKLKEKVKGSIRNVEDAISKSYVPAVLNLFMDLVYAPVPSTVRNGFNLESFRNGKYIKGQNSNGSKGFI